MVLHGTEVAVLLRIMLFCVAGTVLVGTYVYGSQGFGSVLYFTVQCCRLLQWIVLRGTTVYCTAVTVLHCTVVYGSTWFCEVCSSAQYFRCV